jgi:hypothetical protein
VNYISSLDQFKSLTVMPVDYVTSLETKSSGWILAQCALISEKINARLRKRYAVPFTSPYPDIVIGWVVAIVTARGYVKRGANPSDQDTSEIFKQAEEAVQEIKEAADSQNGLFDLPLRSNTTSTGISRGGPLGYSEQSPYRWWNVQANTGREEDSEE